MRQTVAWLSLITVVAFLIAGTLMIPFGAPPSVMDDYIIANAQEETGSNNVVAGVLLDYRGLDTLGEITVLFTAVMGVLLVLRASKRGGEA